MLAIAKAHPDHPGFDKWAQQLTDLVSGKAEVIRRPCRDGRVRHARARGARRADEISI